MPILLLGGDSMKLSNILYALGKTTIKIASLVNDTELLIDGKLDKLAKKRVNRKIHKSMYNIYRKIRLK